MTAFKTCLALAATLACAATSAAPVIYNDAIAAGTAAFDATITGAGAQVKTLKLSGLSSDSSWDLGDFTISATNGVARSIETSYLDGDAITINPASPAAGSGLTFTFDQPINAFGLEVGDWATCCYLPSSLYISFDGGATRLVASAFGPNDNPGVPAGDGFRNFVAAIDDSATFTTITFYGDGFGEALYAGGTLRWATVDEGSVTPVPEPGTYALMALGLGAIGLLRRRRTA